jgi:hypothetical protein
MRRYGLLGIAALVAFALTSCDGSPAQKAARTETATSHPTFTTSASTSTTTRTFPPQQPSAVAHLGGTLAFTAQLGSGAPTAALRITLDQVIHNPEPYGSSPAYQSGVRDVELKVTMKNVGDVTVPVAEGDEYELSIEWALDPDLGNADGVPTYEYEGLPSPTCIGAMTNFPQPGILPGESVTGCVDFGDISTGISVHSATALLLYAGTYNGAPGEWLIP